MANFSARGERGPFLFAPSASPMRGSQVPAYLLPNGTRENARSDQGRRPSARAREHSAASGGKGGRPPGLRRAGWAGWRQVEKSQIRIPVKVLEVWRSLAGHQGPWARAFRRPRARAANQTRPASKAVAPVAGSGTATGGHGESSKRFEWNRIEFFRAFALGESVSTCYPDPNVLFSQSIILCPPTSPRPKPVFVYFLIPPFTPLPFTQRTLPAE